MTRVPLFALLGAFAVLVGAEPTPAQDAPKERELKAPYDEWVTFKYRAIGEKFEFLRPVKAAAYRKESEGKVRFFLEGRASGGLTPTPGSQIIDKDEVVWVITKATPNGPHICEVVKQPPAKKKATRKG